MRRSPRKQLPRPAACLPACLPPSSSQQPIITRTRYPRSNCGSETIVFVLLTLPDALCVRARTAGRKGMTYLCPPPIVCARRTAPRSCFRPRILVTLRWQRLDLACGRSQIAAANVRHESRICPPSFWFSCFGVLAFFCGNETLRGAIVAACSNTCGGAASLLAPVKGTHLRAQRTPRDVEVLGCKEAGKTSMETTGSFVYAVSLVPAQHVGGTFVSFVRQERKICRFFSFFSGCSVKETSMGTNALQSHRTRTASTTRIRPYAAFCFWFVRTCVCFHLPILLLFPK